MFKHLIVPIDGSPASFYALPVASRLATAFDAQLEVISVRGHFEMASSKRALERELDRLRDVSGASCQLLITDETAAQAISDMVRSTPDSLVVMSSHGHGRSAAVLGSTTDEVLRAISGPIVVVGPNCDVDDASALDGNYIAPVDGSARAEQVLPIVSTWALRLGGNPWLVKAADDIAQPVSDRSYLSAVAHGLRRRTGRVVGYEVLEGDHAARAIVEFARSSHASLIFVSTHGRTGLARLRSGSVAAEVVRTAPCPVVMVRPNDLTGPPDAPNGDGNRTILVERPSDEADTLLLT
jgi:nucleotide-binding universal stress UspA family protein